MIAPAGSLFLRSALAAAVLALWLRTFVLSIGMVASGSMSPTLEVGDLVFFNLLIYRLPQWPLLPSRSPVAGDILLLNAPRQSSKPLIKRCVASARQRVEARSGRLLVDAEPERLPSSPRTWTDDLSARSVPDGRLFVLGDNRRASRDSRHFGALEVATVQAAAFVRVPRGKHLPRTISQPFRSQDVKKRHP